MALLDLTQFARELAARRNKAALLLTPDIRDQHPYAAQLALSLEAPHFDVLDHFQTDSATAERLGAFSLPDLFQLIARQPHDGLLVVSGIEFLLAAWIAQEEPKKLKLRLCQQIELWDRAPAFLLVTHHDSVFAGYQPARHTGSRVIIEFSQTLALA